MSGNQGRANYQQQPNIQQQQRFSASPFSDGYAQAHQNQAIYQTQGGPPGVQNQQQSQSNPAQSLNNAVQQNQQARLTPMSQPTAPSTPPTQQQQQQQPQQQQQGAPQYAVQLGQQGIPPTAGGAGNPRSTQYRPTTQQRRPQQPLNQQYIYQPSLGGMPYGFVLPHGAHVRAPTTFGYMPFPQMYNQFAPAAPNYQQIPAQSNGQQRPSAQPQASAPAMAQPQTGEYAAYQSLDVYQPVMQSAPVPTQQAPPPQAQPQKTVKKPGSKAIKIINPMTGKNIFDDDAAEGGASSGSIATVDKAITASHNELNKDEAGDKEQQEKEPSTPVVSAMSDGPSVDITPKHQVNKSKKKPPEPVVQPPAPQAPAVQPQEAPKAPVEPEAATPVPPPAAVITSVAQLPKDNENNNVTEATVVEVAAPAQIPAAPEPVIEKEVAAAPVPQPQPVVLDVNDTNNNNYEEVKPEVEELKEEAAPVPQDSNNNSTDDKSIMTSPSIRAAPPQETPSRKTSSVDGPIDYDDGQWSPANLAGKKYYTRDQLLRLKDLPIAAGPPAMTTLPENVANVLMKNNKETLTNTLTQTMPPPGMAGSMARGNVNFDPTISVAPKFMSNQMGGRNPFPKRPSQTGNKGQQGPGNRNSQPGIIKMSLSLHDDVKLNEAENAWKPTHLVKKADLPEEDRVTSDLLNRFRSMLNKLTAENFDILVKEVKMYKIDTSERLDGVIQLVFEKAISEPKFAPTYANLCREVSYITTAPQGDGQQKKNTLRVKLITQCQREFERHKEESKVFNDIEEKLREIENQAAPEKRLEEEKTRLEEEHYRVRQRANGTVKFIGELFKIDMLTSKIMRSCIEMLLQEVTEEKIERVCKLLTTIGGKLEQAEGRTSLNRYFEQLHEMLRPTHAIIRSSRIKFEIQNLQDLRHNNWKSRRVEATPKTLDQIQNEIEHEQQMINYQTRQNAKDDRNRGGNYGGGNNRNNRQQQQQDSDGWSVQQNKNSRSAPIQFKNIAIPSMTSEAKLGGPANFQNFMVQNTNKFSGLPVDTDTDGPPRFGGGSKNSSMERNRDSRNYYNNNGGSSGGNAPYSGRSSGSGQGSRNSSRARDDSGGRGGPSRSLQAPPRHQQIPMATASSSMSFSGAVKKEGAPAGAPAKPMTADEIKKNYTEMLAIVNAFRDDKLNMEDAMTKLKPLAISKEVLVEIYNKFLDRKDIDRENLMLLICELVKSKKVSRDENLAALVEIMEFAPDIAPDVPRVYEYFAQFLAELIIASVLTFQDVYQVCEADIKTQGENMLLYIFTATEKRHGAPRLQQIVADTNCDLGKFIADGNLNRWLEANKFTDKVRRGARGIADVMTSIKQMLNDKNQLDVIMNYINSTDCTNDPSFIRNLTKVIIEFCCDEYSTTAQPSYKLQNTRLADLSQLLQRYIDNETNRELQCINALQNFALDRDFPSGLLNSTFEVLYDNDVLSLEAFEMWKNDNENQQGKGVAICSTRQFFTKLEEDKDDDDGDFYAEEGDTL